MAKKLVCALLACVLVAVAAGCAKIVPIDQVDELTGNQTFDAAESAGGMWDDAKANIEEKAVDLPTFLTEAGGDLGSLVDQYGKYSMGDSGTISYAVKGSGTVEEVNQDSRAGYATIKLDGYDGPEVIKLQIGEIYKGSSTRDTLDIVSFGDYTNQEEWAAVSQALHTMIDENVIKPSDPSTWQGQKIDFTGTFTVDGNDELLVTAVDVTKE